MNAANFTSRPKVSFFHALFPQAVLRHEYWNGFLGAVDEENVEPQNEGEVVGESEIQVGQRIGVEEYFLLGRKFEVVDYGKYFH